MQAHRYFLLVNNQQLDQVIAFDEGVIVNFINEHIQARQYNKLTFYRVIKWLKKDDNSVLNEDKNVILESSATDKINSDHEMVTTIMECKETLRNLQAARFDVEQYLKSQQGI